MQNLKETDLCFQKWHEECGKFSLEHLKVSKMELWWDAFIQGRKRMSLKFTIYSYVSWQWRMIQNLKRNWSATSKLTWGIDEFWPEHLEISKNCTLKNISKNSPLKGCFWPKYIMFELKNTEELCLTELKIGVEFEGNLTCAQRRSYAWHQFKVKIRFNVYSK